MSQYNKTSREIILLSILGYAITNSLLRHSYGTLTLSIVGVDKTSDAGLLILMFRGLLRVCVVDGRVYKG